MNLYLLPGMGGDQRLFANFHLEGTRKIVLPWKEPKNHKDLAAYAREMAKDIDTSQPFILGGCSMGGMVAVEMTKFLQPEHLILFSTAKTYKELPLQIRMWRHFPLYRIVPASWLLAMSGRTAKRMGLKDDEGRKLFRDMLDVNGSAYLKKAIHLVVNWRNEEIPEKFIHVHGTNDKVLPLRNVGESRIPIKKGSHFMVLLKGDEMSALIQDQLPLSIRGIKPTSNKAGQSLPVT